VARVVRYGRAVWGPSSLRRCPGPREQGNGRSRSRCATSVLFPCDPFPAPVAPSRLALRSRDAVEVVEEVHPGRFSIRNRVRSATLSGRYSGTAARYVFGALFTAARFNLADQLKEEITDAAPDLGASVYSDLLQAAIDSVNWQEIADNLIESLDD
jgi:hypothetical protein